MPPPQFQDDDEDVQTTSNISSEFRLNAPQVDHVGSDTGRDHEDDDSSLSSNEGNATMSISHHDPTTSYVPPRKESYTDSQRQKYRDEEAARNPQDEEEVSEEAMTRTMVIVIMVFILLLIGGVIAVVSLTVANKGGGSTNNAQNSETNPPSAAPVNDISEAFGDETSTSIDGDDDDLDYGNVDIFERSPTLKAVVDRGYLLCGTFGRQPGFSIVTDDNEAEGFDTDLCRAVAAAIFGEDGHAQFEVLSNFARFQALNNGLVDMLAQGTTHTMERSIHEPIAGAGFSFSTPYLYEGLQFAGQPPFVECADSFRSDGICGDTVICVLDASTHFDEIIAVYPNASITASVDSISVFRNFVDGFCNVVAGEGFGITETLARELGYVGEYAFGTKVISKEPLALVTRPNDPVWSDFVNWIVQALIVAEDLGITSETAMTKIGPTPVFGFPFRNMFRDAISVVGNYRQVYDRWLKPLLPRPIQDQINVGTSPALFAFPFGGGGGVLDQPVNLVVDGSAIDRIVSRGVLRCGVRPRPLFAEFDAQIQSWSGFEVDFCSALAAALFNGLQDRVVYSTLENVQQGFERLEKGDIDVLAGVTHTLAGDVFESTLTNTGFTMSPPIFHDGLSFGGPPELVQCADNLETHAIECREMTICVEADSRQETYLRRILPQAFIVSTPAPIDGLISGECNVLAGTSEDLSLTSVKNAGYATATSSTYTVGVNQFSKQPNVLATASDDHDWSQFVYWIVSALIYADEKGITEATAEEFMPTMPWFGLNLQGMFRNAIAAVGSYSDIYRRNLQNDIPRASMNKVNDLLRGPQHVPLPGI